LGNKVAFDFSFKNSHGSEIGPSLPCSKNQRMRAVLARAIALLESSVLNRFLGPFGWKKSNRLQVVLKPADESRF